MKDEIKIKEELDSLIKEHNYDKISIFVDPTKKHKIVDVYEDMIAYLKSKPEDLKPYNHI